MIWYLNWYTNLKVNEKMKGYDLVILYRQLNGYEF